VMSHRHQPLAPHYGDPLCTTEAELVQMNCNARHTR
jgi:hypothetical protein